VKVLAGRKPLLSAWGRETAKSSCNSLGKGFCIKRLQRMAGIATEKNIKVFVLK
jgi:hypothetical protein